MSKSFVGRVIEGRQKARQSGYPTANILSNKLEEDLAGCWVGVIEPDKFQTCYFVGIIPAGGGLIEAHIYELDENIYGNQVDFTLVHKVDSQGLTLDVEKYRKKRCDKCRFCTLKDYGYSAYTVLGTTSECELEQRSEYDYSSYWAQAENLFAVQCERYKKGEPTKEHLE